METPIAEASAVRAEKKTSDASSSKGKKQQPQSLTTRLIEHGHGGAANKTVSPAANLSAGGLQPGAQEPQGFVFHKRRGKKPSFPRAGARRTKFPSVHGVATSNPGCVKTEKRSPPSAAQPPTPRLP